MRTIIHEIDKRTRRISLVHPEKQNDLANAGKHFTATQKAVAKLKYQAYLKNRKRNSFFEDRAALIETIAGTKHTPKMNLIVTVNTNY